jgi:hypothetical protein
VLEDKLGLTNRPRVAVVHEKDGIATKPESKQFDMEISMRRPITPILLAVVMTLWRTVQANALPDTAGLDEDVLQEFRITKMFAADGHRHAVIPKTVAMIRFWATISPLLVPRSSATYHP